MFKYTITKGYTVLDLSSVNLKIKYIVYENTQTKNKRKMGFPRQLCRG